MEPQILSQGDHLLLRNGVYYYRRRVPESAVGRLGKREIAQSLRTPSLAKAKRLRNLLDAKFDLLFADPAESGSRASCDDGLAGASALSQIQQYLVRLAARARADFFSSPPASNEEYRQMEESIGTAIDILQDRDDPRSDEMVSRVIRAVLNVSDVETSVAEAIRRGLLLVEREKLARLEDREDLAVSLSTPIGPKSAETFGQTAAGYLEVLEKSAAANGTNQKWVDKQGAHIDTLSEIIGKDTPICEVGFEVCEKVQLTLAEMPAHRLKRFPGRTLAQAIEEARANDAQLIGSTTQNGYLATLDGLLDRAHRKGLIVANPAGGLKALKRHELPPEERRLPLRPDQLKSLFSGSYYRSLVGQGWKGDSKGWRFWLPLLTAYMGMRPNESCQLEAKDLKVTVSGIPYLDFTGTDEDPENGSKQLKTRSSRRRIPVHPLLVDLGFIDFVEFRRQAGMKQLFPSLKPDRSGNFAKYAMKQFREVYLPQDVKLGARQSFYSLRHNFRDALRSVNAPAEVLEGIGGWRQSGNRNVSDMYGDRFNPDFTYAWLRQVSFEGVKFEFLGIG